MSKPSDQVPSDQPTIPRDIPASSLPAARPGGNMYERAERRYLAELAAIQGDVATVASAQEAFADPEVAAPAQSEPQPEDLPQPEQPEIPATVTLPPPPVLARPVAAPSPAVSQRASTRRRQSRSVLALAAVLLVGALAAAVTIRSALAPPPPEVPARPAATASKATPPPESAPSTATAASATPTPAPPTRTTSTAPTPAAPALVTRAASSAASRRPVTPPAAPAPTAAPTSKGTSRARAEPLARAVQPDIRRATATSPLASDGALRVTSTPSGARVTVNGIGWGQTPLTINHLPFGTKSIRLTHDGYVSQERAVGLDSGHPSASLRVTLRKR